MDDMSNVIKESKVVQREALTLAATKLDRPMNSMLEKVFERIARNTPTLTKEDVIPAESISEYLMRREEITYVVSDKDVREEVAKKAAEELKRQLDVAERKRAKEAEKAAKVAERKRAREEKAAKAAAKAAEELDAAILELEAAEDKRLAKEERQLDAAILELEKAEQKAAKKKKQEAAKEELAEQKAKRQEDMRERMEVARRERAEAKRKLLAKCAAAKS